jgi:hypothetical protein
LWDFPPDLTLGFVLSEAIRRMLIPFRRTTLNSDGRGKDSVIVYANYIANNIPKFPPENP